MVRAKMKLQAITQFTYGDQRELIFRCEYDPSLPEDQRFSKYTPTGEFKMLVDNPAALEQFKLGEAYYLDFTPVPAPVPAAV